MGSAADASLLAAALIAEWQLTQRVPAPCSRYVVPAGLSLLVLCGNQHYMFLVLALSGLSRGPGRVV